MPKEKGKKGSAPSGITTVRRPKIKEPASSGGGRSLPRVGGGRGKKNLLYYQSPFDNKGKVATVNGRNKKSPPPSQKKPTKKKSPPGVSLSHGGKKRRKHRRETSP